jgi:thiosulfate/3-mercaptopyruvate sulfurtransferase
MKICIFIVCILVLFTSNSNSQNPIMTADEFINHFNHKKLKIIDASDKSTYEHSHIKGSVNLPFTELNQKQGNVEGLMETPEKMAKILGELGIRENDEIIIYDDGTTKSSSRVYWLLKYLGASNVRLLHKQMNIWENAGFVLTNRCEKIKPKKFVPKVNNNMLISLKEIEKDIDKIVLIDARDVPEYLGTDTGEKAYSKGHFPNAISVEYKSLLNDNYSFKSVEEISKILENKGLTKDKNYVIYCRIGLRATVVYFAFTELLHYPNVKLYDGSYVEWNFEGKPLVK